MFGDRKSNSKATATARRQASTDERTSPAGQGVGASGSGRTGLSYSSPARHSDASRTVLSSSFNGGGGKAGSQDPKLGGVAGSRPSNTGSPDVRAGILSNGKTGTTAEHRTGGIGSNGRSSSSVPVDGRSSNSSRLNNLAAVLDSKKPAAGISTASLSASLSRGRLASSFKGTSQQTSMAYTTPSRVKPQSTPIEYQYVLDDVTLTYGHSSFQGARDYQEDTVACVPLPTGLAGGVFDGHGGDDVSKELERVLLQNINRQIADVCARSPDDVRAMQTAIHHAYVNTNNEIGGRMDAAMEAGSCAVTAFVTRVQGRPYLLCANAGDCRAVLYTQLANGTRRAVRLSEDHKPQPSVCPSEITRITDAGGCVLWGRVQGCLAVSRAFGDRTLQPYVIPDPHVLGRPLDPDADLFFYLASDGVTDMVDDALGCNVIAEQLHKGCNTTQAAAALVSAAYQKGSCDNISVLLVRIRRRQPGDKTGPVGA
ncbi:phosphatase 2C-like domain-containing protein [Haematococcus lacustris]